MRLLSVPLLQSYTDFAWKTNTIGAYSILMPVTDPSLAVGRFTTGWTAGLRIAGADRSRFESNRFTTRPRSVYFEPDPTNTSLAKWRPLSRPTNNVDGGTYQDMTQTGTVTFNSNLVSSTTMDFAGFTLIQAPTNALDALLTNSTGLVPGGNVRRVALETNEDGRLLGVYEVAIADPVQVGDTVQVQARLVFHPTPIDPNSVTSRVCNPQTLRLVVRGSDAITEGMYTSGVTNNIMTFTYTAAANGWDEIAVFDDPEGQHNDWWVDEDAVAWSRAEIRLGTTLRFERTPDVADDRRLAYGTVRISRSGPTASPLTFELKTASYGTRAGSADPQNGDFELRTDTGVLIPAYGVSPICWNVTIPAGSKETTVRIQPKPGTEDLQEYEVAYVAFPANPDGFALAPPAPWTTAWSGAPASGENAIAITLWDGPKYRLYPLSDYYSCGSPPPALAQGGPPEVASDGSSADAEDPASDSPAEATEPQGWAPRSTRVLLDPNEWDPEGRQPVEEVESDSAQMMRPQPTNSFYSSAAYALNSQANPALGGSATFYNGTCSGLPSPYFSLMGFWNLPACDDLSNVGPACQSYPAAVIYGVDESGNMAGTWGALPCYVQAGTTNAVLLPGLDGINAGGEALWLPPSSGQPVGWANRRINGVNYARPTRWLWSSNSWHWSDLGSFDGVSTTTGYAYMANDAGVTVGKSRVAVGTNTGWRAFRTTPGGLISPSCALALPSVPDGLAALINNAANGVNSNGAAVGASDTWFNRVNPNSPTNKWGVETRAVVWWEGDNTAPKQLPMLEPIPTDITKQSGRSEAFALSAWRADGTTPTIVGSAWATPTGLARAFVHKVSNKDLLYSKTLNLNDPHLTWMPTGWTLSTAEAVNELGWIVGNGNGPSSGTQGFVLVPQPAVDH